MTDLHDRFRSLDRLRAPDLWAEVTTRASQGPRARSQSPLVLSPTLRMALVLLGLLLVTSIGLAAVGGLLRNDGIDAKPVPTNDTETGSGVYEAVFLRLEVDGSREVVVVGVNAQGDEREIARLPGAWEAYQIDDGQYLAPMGAVSNSGLLAMPSRRGEGASGLSMHWEIFDLHRPGAEPIVVDGIRQDIEQLESTPYFSLEMLRPSVFWGPGDRVAIPWYNRRPDPDDPNAFGFDRHVSLVEGRTGVATSVDVPDTTAVGVLPYWTADGSGVLFNTRPDVDSAQVLRGDGTLTDLAGAVADSACSTRYRSGAEISIRSGRVELRNPDGSLDELSSPGPAQFACIAPDESAIVVSVDVSGFSTSPASNPMAALIPASGGSVEVEGSFAGWLDVDR